MNPKGIVDLLKPDKFEPWAFFTNSGDRYEVRRPELARVMTNGTIHLFIPSDREDAHDEGYVRLGHSNIAAIKPLEHSNA